MAMQRDQLIWGAPDPVNLACSVNRGTMGYSVRAMLAATAKYLDKGTVPPSAPRIERQANGDLARDADGLAKGGLRHPFVQVPVALNRSTSDDCVNWGTYQPWTDEKIRSRYVSHGTYINQVKAWANFEVSQGLDDPPGP